MTKDQRSDGDWALATDGDEYLARYLACEHGRSTQQARLLINMLGMNRIELSAAAAMLASPPLSIAYTTASIFSGPPQRLRARYSAG